MDPVLLAAEVSRLRGLLGMAVEALQSTNGSHCTGFIDALREAAGVAAIEVRQTPETGPLDVATPRAHVAPAPPEDATPQPQWHPPASADPRRRRASGRRARSRFYVTQLNVAAVEHLDERAAGSTQPLVDEVRLNVATVSR